MKLELKHLSPYLPYALPMMKGLHIGYLQCVKQPTENSLRNYFEFMITNSGYWENSIEDTNPYKPILRPLSDLKTNECYNKLSHSLSSLIERKGFPHYKDLRVCDYDILLKNHFDVFGLINKGLAIDINTLSEQNGV